MLKFPLLLFWLGFCKINTIDMKIHVKFQFIKWVGGGDNSSKYTCTIENASITKPGTEITKVIGKHLEDNKNKDVEAIYFKDSVVEFFPRGLHKIFTRLTDFNIFGCGLKEITREDLNGLENLEALHLNRNELQTLPSDLFIGMHKLKAISFYINKLQFLSSKMLLPIIGNGLNSVNFGHNPIIDQNYCPEDKGNVNSLQELMDIIDKECSEPLDVKHYSARVVKDLWTSKDYSDFIIIGGGGDEGGSKKFAVHKCVLGLQSTVLAAAFKNDMKEKKTGTLTIEDFSADAVEGMLEFMYTGELKEDIAMDLYAIAGKYNVELLMEKTEKLVLHNINESNAIEVFGLGHLNNSDEMKRAAFEKIKKMIPEMKINDSLMYKPEDLKEIVEAYRNRKRKIQEAEKEFRAEIHKFG